MKPTAQPLCVLRFDGEHCDFIVQYYHYYYLHFCPLLRARVRTLMPEMPFALPVAGRVRARREQRRQRAQEGGPSFPVSLLTSMCGAGCRSDALLHFSSGALTLALRDAVYGFSETLPFSHTHTHTHTTHLAVAPSLTTHHSHKRGRTHITTYPVQHHHTRYYS